MQKEISFSALGGIGENGKNFYLLKIKSSYFILDVGLKYPDILTHGIDSIIPEYTKLDLIKEKIKAIFITSAFETHSGALPYLIQNLNIPIYASDFVVDVIKNNLKNNNIDVTNIIFHTINENSKINFSDTVVSFFNIAHFLPETLGLSFKTSHGYIIYISEMHFLQSKDKNFQTNFSSLAKLGEKKVLAFIPASQGAFSIIKQKKKELLEYYLSSYFASIKNNIIISFLIPDLLKIQLAINLAVEFNLKIVILGRKSEKIIDLALKKGYLKIPEGFLVDLKNSNDFLKYKNLVIIVVGKRFEPFYRLQRMCKQTDRLMRLNPQDKILLLSIEVNGIDKIQSKTLDILARSDFIVDILIEDLLTASYNYEENFELMLHLLKPQFLLPVVGEYRHQYQIKKIAQNFNYKEKNIFMFENGDQWIYDTENKPYIKKKFFKNLGEILIDGTPVLDGNNYILKDRELLANDGVIILVCGISTRIKRIIGNIELISKGFLDKNKIENMCIQLKEIFIKNICDEFLNNTDHIKWSDFKNNLKETLSKFVFKETRKKPVIIPVLISVY
ncbi:ribonuclease J [Candidatus Phytoplasma sacchari]|nr:ribonuclease J [Candidatus Phytoplasma sacchari]KAB8122866.1 ribonuclease J [Candidatus Phytoplasma sacchari]